MNEMQLLTWARGTGLNLALSIFILGMIWRLIEIYSLGRKTDISPARQRPGASGLNTVWRRSLVPPGMLKRSPVSYLGGYVFHVGLLVVVMLFAPHIKLIQGLIGLSWTGLPSQIIDLASVLTMAAMVVMLVDRVTQPVKRYLSGFEDYFTWALTFLPLLSGYLTVKHLLLPYTTMLALHILSVELLLVFIPFTKLIHVATLFGSRWYNGEINGHRGVAT